MNGSKPPSEADCLALRISIFLEWLPLGTHLAMHQGEQGCAATTLSKSKPSAIFEIGTSPGKCDCLLTVGSVEVGNFECKRASASKLDVAVQIRKNIRINKNILLELQKYRLDCPLLLSVHVSMIPVHQMDDKERQDINGFL
ncbi:hypothetical protein BGZ49_006319 [Haplosporangium sp. Z 27]|nr:hypothetical protein BGZ49_006319 [Haplosporangium sp. Z 27]